MIDGIPPESRRPKALRDTDMVWVLHEKEMSVVAALGAADDTRIS
jgi:hypothetical protein